MAQKKINRTEYIEHLAISLGISKVQAETVIKSVLDIIVENVSDGNIVNLTGFGSFYPITRKDRWGVDPRSGDKIKIKSSKSAGFRLGKQFKDKVKGE
jgi:DNA-binding protein HU-beta